MAAGDPLLVLDKVDKHFGGLHVLTDLDFEVREEEIVGLIGPNGAGKSTVFNLVTSIYPIDRGSIRFKGKEIAALLRTRSATWGYRGPISSSGLFSRCRCKRMS